jgi:hypothetical protein
VLLRSHVRHITCRQVPYLLHAASCVLLRFGSYAPDAPGERQNGMADRDLSSRLS